MDVILSNISQSHFKKCHPGDIFFLLPLQKILTPIKTFKGTKY